MPATDATLSPSDRSEREGEREEKKERGRERERVRKRGRERRRERERERERRKERKRGREGERDVEYGCFIFIFNGMTGALAPFSYLVWYIAFLHNKKLS